MGPFYSKFAMVDIELRLSYLTQASKATNCPNHGHKWNRERKRRVFWATLWACQKKALRSHLESSGSSSRGTPLTIQDSAPFGLE